MTVTVTVREAVTVAVREMLTAGGAVKGNVKIGMISYSDSR